jgi:hypothetical protein
MKHVLCVLALAGASSVAVPALAQPTDPTYRAIASGQAEVPPNASAGSSVATIELNGSQLVVDLPFSDLSGTSTVAHIHCCTADAFTGTAAVAVPFTDFPTGVRAGNYEATFRLDEDSTYAPAFLAANGGSVRGAYAALVDGINANEAYVNIHSALYPNGEIRGFLVAAPIPEPAEWAMLGAGLAGLLWLRRRKQEEEPLSLKT